MSTDRCACPRKTMRKKYKGTSDTPIPFYLLTSYKAVIHYHKIGINVVRWPIFLFYMHLYEVEFVHVCVVL